MSDKNYNLKENNQGHPENSLLEWCSGDLRARLQLSVRYAERILNPDFDNHPHFAYTRDRSDGEGFGHGSQGTLMAHAVGRAIDLILNIEKYTGIKTNPTVEAEYIRHFFNNIDSDYGMCIEYTDDSTPLRIELHNVRETVESYSLLIEMRDDKRVYPYINKLFCGLDLITDKSKGKYSMEMAREAGLLWERMNGSIGATQPQGAGRLTGPLMWLYRITGDRRALEYAALFARGTLDCFDDEGRMTEAAGTHIHSTTSSLFGAADYAVYTRDNKMLDKMKKIYNHPEGLPVVMSDYGWVKEQIWVPGARQGESNQIGDIIQFQLIMANYYPEESTLWYSRAETFMRSGLLPSQVLENDFINDTLSPKNNDRYDIKSRILGGYGFPMPASHLENEGSPINTLDITQGVCQAICRFIEKIAVRRNGETFINLFFTHENEAASVYSELPKKGSVIIILKQSGYVYIRLPGNAKTDSYKFKLDNKDISYKAVHGYAGLGLLKQGDVIKLTFEPDISYHKQTYIDTEYTIKKFGEQVVDVSPIDGIYPLYYDFTC